MTTYAIIGDSHECVEELRLLIDKVSKNIPGVQFVHVGDCVDKGQNTRKMIHFMWERVIVKGDLFIPGNHEMFVYQRLRGELGALEDPARERALFGSQDVLVKDYPLAQKFDAIIDAGLPFLVITEPFNILTKPVYVTHAPCKLEHLGQYDEKSVREQRNYRTIDRTIPTFEDLKWLYDEADVAGPLHIFGHMAHSGKNAADCIYHNKVFLDTGCVYDNGLSAAIVEGGVIIDWYFQPSLRQRHPGFVLPGPLGLRRA